MAVMGLLCHSNEVMPRLRRTASGPTFVGPLDELRTNERTVGLVRDVILPFNNMTRRETVRHGKIL